MCQQVRRFLASLSVRNEEPPLIQGVIELTAQHDRLSCTHFAPAQLP
jgi:hypothetical protein